MTNNLDPFEMWKNYFNQSSSLIDEKMKEQFPSQAMGQILDMNLMYQKVLNETTEKYLEQLNVPTSKDIAKISSLIINVDSKVDDLEELLEETRAKQLNITELQLQITNFGKELKSLDSKLNQILTQLKSLTEANNNEAAKNKKAAQVKETPVKEEEDQMKEASENKEVTHINAASGNNEDAQNKATTVKKASQVKGSRRTTKKQ